LYAFIIANREGRPVSERIYVSDADVQSACDFETLRIERRLIDDLSSAFPGKRKKIRERIMRKGKENPIVIMPVLLRYHANRNPKVRDQIRQLTENLLQVPGGEGALIESLFSAHLMVSDAATELLETRGLEAKRFRDLYIASEKLFYDCTAMKIHIGDIRELVVEAINRYKEKALEQAFENIILAHDLLRDRLDWNENLRKYIKDVLRLAPELSHSGVQIDNIQESLKALTNAVKSRDYGETRELIEGKKVEAAIRRELSSAFAFISKRVQRAEDAEGDEIAEEDAWIFDAMKKVSNEIFDSLKEDNKLGALKSLHTFIAHDYTGKYLGEMSARIESGDEEAKRAARESIIGMAKILALILPNIASDLFDTYRMREIANVETVDELPWPKRLQDIERKRRR